jgi:HEAT repeat protein
MVKKVLFFLLIFTCMTSALNAGDPTLDRLISNMMGSDANKKAKAKQQLFYLSRYGHDTILYPYLKSDKVEVRKAAISVAASIKHSDYLVGLVADSLNSKDVTLKRMAAQALANYQDEKASTAIVNQLNGEAATLVALLDAIAKAKLDVGAEKVAEQLSHKSYLVRHAAANALYQCQVKDQSAAIKKALTYEASVLDTQSLIFSDYHDKTTALLYASLLVSGDEAGEALSAQIASKSILVRQLTVEAYSVAKNSSLSASCLEVLQNNSNSRIRRSAAEGLTAIADPKEVPAIIELLKTEEKAFVLEELAQCLRRISGNNYGFNGVDSKVKRAAAEVLWAKWWRENAYRFGLSVR